MNYLKPDLENLIVRALRLYVEEYNGAAPEEEVKLAEDYADALENDTYLIETTTPPDPVLLTIQRTQFDAPKFAPGTEVYIRKVDKTRTVVSSEHTYGHERRYTLRERDGTLDEGWREDELELIGEVGDTGRQCACFNCGWNGGEAELGEIKGFYERVQPGDTAVPAGECPECGCLAYLKDEDDELLLTEPVGPAPIPPPDFTDEEKADMKHNAQMLDGCETEDEVNAELRAQTQGDA